MLRIRLSRRGAKKDPHYRLVVSEKSSPRDGRFLEIVGYYNPALKPVRLSLDLDRIDYWVDKGAQPSATVRALINRVKAPPVEAKESAEAPPVEAKKSAEEAPAEAKESAEEAPAEAKKSAEEAPAEAKESAEEAPAAAVESEVENSE